MNTKPRAPHLCSTRCLFRTRYVCHVLIATLLLTSTFSASASPAETTPIAQSAIANTTRQPQTAVDAMVRRAMIAELEGNNRLRQNWLAKAIQTDPLHAGARWQAGYVRIGDNWLTVDQSVRLGDRLALLKQYRILRDQYSGHLVGEVLIARWCRKQGLVDREQLHWVNVLQLNPQHAEARKRLALREFRGYLLTPQQIEDWKRGVEAYQQGLDKWDPILSRWHREMTASSLPQFTDASHQLSSLNDVAAVPSVEKLFYQVEPEFQTALVLALGNISDQLATDALVRVALWSDSQNVRNAAASELGKRSWFGFVPSLLSQLETPIEYQYQLESLGDRRIPDFGFVSTVRFSKENAESIVTHSHSLLVDTWITDPRTAASPSLLDQNKLFYVQGERQRRYAEQLTKHNRQLANTVRAVENANARTVRRNERIYSILKTATGKQFDSRPKYWWDWWKEYNELEDRTDKPHFRFTHRQANSITMKVLLCPPSCFATGTPVWTDSGTMEIQAVRRGDRVLSQDPITGELSYQVVVGTTIRPQSPTLRIGIEGDEIVTTPGHPMWLAGQGWKMAKHLKVGDRLHGVHGSVEIKSIEPGEDSEAYNLIVDQSNNFFVGQHRVLVHDNLARRVFDLPLPGWIED